MELMESTWPDVAESGADVAVLPVGSTEQHGPHAPLGTDTYAAEAVARAAARASASDVLVSPTIPVGVSEEHRQFAGTLWVSPETFRGYVRETTESLLAGDVSRVVLVNGHGGNVDALREVSAAVTRSRERAFVTAFTWFGAVDADDLGHAGPVETSLLLEIHPELIVSERIESAALDGAEEWGKFVYGAPLTYDSAEFTPNGTVGDPRTADAERGARLLAVARDALTEVIAAAASVDPDRERVPRWEG